MSSAWAGSARRPIPPQNRPRDRRSWVSQNAEKSLTQTTPMRQPGLTSDGPGEGSAGDRARESVLMASFSIVSRRSAGVHFLTPVGRLDRISGPLLENEFNAVARGTASLIVVNLSRLTMLTPAGIETLLRINDACAEGAGRLRVINGSRPVARALETTGACERLPIMSPRSADPTPI